MLNSAIKRSVALLVMSIFVSAFAFAQGASAPTRFSNPLLNTAPYGYGYDYLPYGGGYFSSSAVFVGHPFFRHRVFFRRPFHQRPFFGHRFSHRPFFRGRRFH